MLFLSILAYCGAILLFLSVLALVRPIRCLGIGTRRRALIAAVVGVLLVTVVVLWPAPTVRVARVVSAIDEIIPAYQFAEHHEIVINASPDTVLRAIREVTAAEIRYFLLLTWIRSPRLVRRQESIVAPSVDKPLLAVALGSGFVMLAERPERELVFGTLVAPGVKAVMNFQIHPERPDLVRLTTETRVLGDTDSGRRRFAVYWRVIYPGSALIRVEWLRAIKRRAEGTIGPR